MWRSRRTARTRTRPRRKGGCERREGRGALVLSSAWPVVVSPLLSTPVVPLRASIPLVLHHTRLSLPRRCGLSALDDEVSISARSAALGALLCLSDRKRCRRADPAGCRARSESEPGFISSSSTEDQLPLSPTQSTRAMDPPVGAFTLLTVLRALLTSHSLPHCQIRPARRLLPLLDRPNSRTPPPRARRPPSSPTRHLVSLPSRPTSSTRPSRRPTSSPPRPPPRPRPPRPRPPNRPSRAPPSLASPRTRSSRSSSAATAPLPTASSSRRPPPPGPARSRSAPRAPTRRRASPGRTAAAAAA